MEVDVEIEYHSLHATIKCIYIKQTLDDLQV